MTEKAVAIQVDAVYNETEDRFTRLNSHLNEFADNQMESHCYHQGGFSNDRQFKELLEGLEKNHLEGMQDVVGIFLATYRAPNYVQLVDNVLQEYKTMKYNMSLKIHLLYSHLDFFPANLGTINDKHGERFHRTLRSWRNCIKATGMY